MALTNDEAMVLIKEFCCKRGAPLDVVMEYIEKVQGGIYFREKTISEIVKNEKLIDEFQRWNYKKRQEVLEELTALSQELQPEDYEITKDD